MPDRATLRSLVETTADTLISRGLVNAVQSVTEGDEDGLHYVEIQLLVPEYIYEDDDRLDDVYLAFQMIESGEMVVTVSAHPDRRN